jgi:hypothetical protein
MIQIREKLIMESHNPALTSLGMNRMEQFLALEALNEKQIDAFAEGGGLHTLENPKLDYWAGMDFFTDADIKIEKLEDALPPETRTQPLLSQWEKHSGHYYEINFPDSFCRFNSTLCNKYKNRNLLVSTLKPKSIPNDTNHN